MTWLQLLNFLVLQWFCVRLGRRYRRVSIDQYRDGTTNENIEPAGFVMLTRVLPLTGWWSDYRFLRNGP